jgi:hypothetical protein
LGTQERFGHRTSENDRASEVSGPGKTGDVDEVDVESHRVHLSTIAAVAPRSRLAMEVRGGDAPVARADAYLTYLRPSPDVTRTFCARCGTNLTFFFDPPPSHPVLPIVDISVGSLDNESLNRIRPDRHGRWDDGVDWVKGLLQDGDGGFLIRHPTGAVNRTVPGRLFKVV